MAIRQGYKGELPSIDALSGALPQVGTMVGDYNARAIRGINERTGTMHGIKPKSRLELADHASIRALEALKWIDGFTGAGVVDQLGNQMAETLGLIETIDEATRKTLDPNYKPRPSQPK